MDCSRCGGRTKVLDSRSVEEGIFRKRICEGCGRVFYTAEYEDNEGKDGLNAYWRVRIGNWRTKNVR